MHVSRLLNRVHVSGGRHFRIPAGLAVCVGDKWTTSLTTGSACVVVGSHILALDWSRDYGDENNNNDKRLTVDWRDEWLGRCFRWSLDCEAVTQADVGHTGRVRGRGDGDGMCDPREEQGERRGQTAGLVMSSTVRCCCCCCRTQCASAPSLTLTASRRRVSQARKHWSRVCAGRDRQAARFTDSSFDFPIIIPESRESLNAPARRDHCRHPVTPLN